MLGCKDKSDIGNLMLKSIHPLKQCFSFYENKVLQLMSAGASLERFGDKDLVFIK